MLEVVAAVVFGAAVFAGAHLAEHRRIRQRSTRRLRAAEACGLTAVVSLKARHWGHTPPIQGHAGALRVRFERQETLPATVAMVVERLGHGASGLRLTPQDPAPRAQDVETDVQTGAPGPAR